MLLSDGCSFPGATSNRCCFARETARSFSEKPLHSCQSCKSTSGFSFYLGVILEKGISCSSQYCSKAIHRISLYFSFFTTPAYSASGSCPAYPFMIFKISSPYFPALTGPKPGTDCNSCFDAGIAAIRSAN